MEACIKGTEDDVEVVNDTCQIHNESGSSECMKTCSGALISQRDTDIRSRLGKFLSTKWIGPNMAFAEHIQNPINPGIFIRDAETVGLPLSYRDASAIFDICNEWEKSNDENVREKVRTAWTLPPTSINFQNPTFKAWVIESTKKVVAGLRIPWQVTTGGIKAHFSGMVLQPPCASNEPLRLNPKTENSFAMMAIILPTAHIGGSVQFTSGEDVRQYGTSEASAYGCSLLAWLSNPDVEVVLGSINSGCRVILIYDLFSTEKVHFPSPVSSKNTHELLYNALLDLKEFPEVSGEIPGVFVHVLKHTSEIQFPIYDALETSDRDLVRVLQCIGSEIGIFVYLANIQRKVIGNGIDDGAHFKLNTIILDTVQLNQVFDFDGTQMAQFVKIREQNLVRDFSESFDDWPSSVTNEAEGVSLVHDRVAVLLVVPSCYPSLLLNPANKVRVDASRWLSQAIHTAENSSPGHISREQLRYGCRYIVAEYKAYLDGTKSYSEPPFFDEDIALVIKASVLTGEIDLSFGLEALTLESHLDIGLFIIMYGFAAVENSLSIGMSKLCHFSARRFVLNELETNVLAASSVKNPLVENAMAVWREKQAEEALRDCIYETSDDAHSLILMGTRHGSHFLLTKILPTVRQHITSTGFILNFLNHLALGNSHFNIPRAAVRLCFQVLLPEVTSSLLLLGAKQNNTMKYTPCSSASGSVPEFLPVQDVASKQIAEVICNCLEFSVDTSLDAVVRQLLAEESVSKTYEFETIYLPFLKHLLGMIKELQSWKNKTRRYVKEVPRFQENPSVKTLFQKLVKRHLRRLNSPDPPLPESPKNWIKSKKGCNEDTCRDCKKLDRFLQDPLKKQEEFKVSAARRKHIEQQIRGVAGASDSQGTTPGNIPKTEYRFKVFQDPYPGVLVVEKTHKDWEAQISAWSQKCDLAMDEIERDLVAHGDAVLLGNVLVLMDDLRELIGVKLKVMELCTDLCVKESRWARLSTGR